MTRWMLGLLAVATLGCAATTHQGQIREAAASRAAGAETYQNPVLDHDFPDPAVLKAKDGYFYAYATQTPVNGQFYNVPLARSKDLVRWEIVGDALPQKPAWAATTQNFWAPHVTEVGGRYVMYYSADPDTRDGLALAVAIADSPAGPFTDVGKPLFKGPGFENIDPFPFDDPVTGKKLLYWGSGFKAIKVRELTPDGLAFAPGSVAKEIVLPQQKPYEHLIEGAWVIRRQGWYYLFYSGDNCCERETRYAVMVARSRSALGPFEKLAEATGRADSVILGPSDRWIGVGHNSLITDAAGQDWMLYHAIDPAQKFIPGTQNVLRPMLIDPVDYRDGWPVVGDGHPGVERRRAPVLR